MEQANAGPLYFLWDYDLDGQQVRQLLREGTPSEKAWLQPPPQLCALGRHLALSDHRRYPRAF